MKKAKFYLRLLLIGVFGITLILSLFMFPGLVSATDMETKFLGYAYLFLCLWSLTIIYYQCKAVAK